MKINIKKKVKMKKIYLEINLKNIKKIKNYKINKKKYMIIN